MGIYYFVDPTSFFAFLCSAMVWNISSMDDENSELQIQQLNLSTVSDAIFMPLLFIKQVAMCLLNLLKTPKYWLTR
jgi:hypothetical protein